MRRKTFLIPIILAILFCGAFFISTARAASYYVDATGGSDTNDGLSNGNPVSTTLFDYGTTQATISLTTDESATCGYSSTAGTSFGNMIQLTTTGGTSHSTTISGLGSGRYAYYIKCRDAYGNTDGADYPITFSVANPPVSVPGGPAISEFTRITLEYFRRTTSSIITVRANALNSDSVKKMRFVLDGIPTGPELAAPPYQISLDTSSLSRGFHNITVHAWNAFGNEAVSNTATIEIKDAAKITSSLPPQASSVTIFPKLTRPLDFGSRGEEVKNLQRMVTAHGGIYPSGLVTGYFGLLTRAAVKKCQKMHGLADAGDPGYGFVGPKTRAVLNSHDWSKSFPAN